jgi:hypothetical protein
MDTPLITEPGITIAKATILPQNPNNITKATATVNK